MNQQEIIDGLQRCILDFTNRLHGAEVERHELRTRLSHLQQNPFGGPVERQSVHRVQSAADMVTGRTAEVSRFRHEFCKLCVIQVENCLLFVAYVLLKDQNRSLVAPSDGI